MSSRFAYALLGLTAFVAALVGVLAFAVMRFVVAARQLRGQAREGGERTFMTTALEDAVTRLRTQERAMTARAEASERLSDEIMASLSSGLLVVALDGTIRVLNPAGARLLDLPEAAGASHREMLASAPPLVELLDQCLATGEALPRQTVRVEHAARGPLYFGVSVSPLRDGQGTLRGAICLFTDLTMVVSLEEQLRLKDSLSRLGELTAGLAHEFRNGLATIHGYARLIDPANVPEAYRPYVQGIRDETDGLGQIVTNFLAFARPVALTLGPVDLRSIAGRAIEDLRDDLVARGGRVSLAGRFGTVKGDETLLRQALLNLLRNALEACDEGGAAPVIRVEGDVDELRRLVRLAVIDNGPGVATTVRDRIFTPFFTTKPRGTGLGLALVQKIIVSHDGRISLAASPGGGACFQVDLPLLSADVTPQA
jgi:signal transduction histidine kinase